MLTKWSASLLIGITLLVTLAPGANAQGVDPRVRYQTGPVVTRGWEASLIEGSPNLGRYYWTPISGMGSAYKKVPLPVRPELEQARNTVVNRQEGQIYQKPVQLPLPVAHHTPLQPLAKHSCDVYGKVSTAADGYGKVSTAADGYGKMNTTAVSAQLSVPKVQAKVATYGTPLATYPAATTRTSMQGALSSADVHGQLLK